MTIVQKAENYIFQLFKDKLSSDYIYHNFNHTLRVVNKVKTLIEAEQINEADAEMLVISAWFHDAGYIQGYENHEDNGIIIVKEFLTENNYDLEKIEQIAKLIKATQLNLEPVEYLEKILRDADNAHFGSKNYFEVCDLLREEFRHTKKTDFSELDWAHENLKFFNSFHRFYTEYAKKNWQPIKEENISMIQNMITSLEKGKKEKKKTKELLSQKKLDKMDTPERGIETMFRVTLNNHTQLSQIADSKANILLSVNAIIISIALSTLIPKLDSPSNAHLVFPTFVMLMFSVVSIIFAILSTRPKVSSGSFTRKDIEDKKINLLFFGNFYKMPLDEYTWAMKEMMKDRDYLYDSMIKDLYYLGLVLNRKYKLLRITYTVFMIGIIVSVACFVIAFKRI